MNFFAPELLLLGKEKPRSLFKHHNGLNAFFVGALGSENLSTKKSSWQRFPIPLDFAVSRWKKSTDFVYSWWTDVEVFVRSEKLFHFHPINKWWNSLCSAIRDGKLSLGIYLANRVFDWKINRQPLVILLFAFARAFMQRGSEMILTIYW